MLLRTLTLAALSLMLAACNISGSAQKGPFKAGSSISASQIDTSASPIASTTINTQVASTQGRFSVQQIPWNGWAELVVTGQYFDEFSNTDSSEALTLNTITNKNRRFDTANIHLFSHLAAARMRQRVSDGQNRLSAWRDTQSEIKQLFGLNRITRNINRGVEQLSPTQGSGRYRRDNANLLLFTGSFLATGGNATSLLALTDDFADDAQFNGVGETTFNAIAIAANTEGLLQKLSTNLSANGASNPPNNGDMQELPIWVNTDVVTEPDTTAPEITLIGSAIVEVVQGGTYSEQGATANDNIDADISGDIVIAGDTIDTSEAGSSFTVTYNVSDAAGNPAVEVTRTVNITQAADTTPPVIILEGSAVVEVVQGTTYVDAGATASDDRDGNLTESIATVNPVDTNADVGSSFRVTYNVSDAAGNPATEVTRTVNIIPVADLEDPVIKITGADPVEVEVKTSYQDAGATATDNVDTDVAITTTSNVDINKLGEYQVTYTAKDSSNNQSSEIRTVKVVDTTPPVISLLNPELNPQSITVATPYQELGATATDNYDSEVNVIVNSSAVKIDTVGSYSVIYTATDSSGNPAVKKTRTVKVEAAPLPDPYKIVLRVFINGDLVNVDNLTLTRPRNTSRTSIYNSIESTAAIVDSTGRVIEGKKPSFDISNIDLTIVGETVVTLSFTDEFQRTVTNTVTIGIINNAPVAAAQAVEVNQDTANNAITLGATDIDQNDSLTYTITSPPSNGSLSGTAPDITYTPNTGFIGDDNFTFTAKDGLAESTATVTITVKDKEKPVITLNGLATVNVVQGADYNEQGASARDNHDGVIRVTTGGDSVNTNSSIGTRFTVTYSAKDVAGNTATIERTVIIIEQPVVVANTCTATAITELGGIIPGPVPFNKPPFRDFFVTNEKGNIPWPEGQNYNQLTVSDIENIFNRARQDDPTTYGVALKMPTQAVWDAYSGAEKALYLINSERCDREIRPYEGIDTAKNIDPSKNYAELLATQFAAGELTELTHEADGNPKIRLERAGVYEEVRGDITANDINADSFQFSENLARNSVSLRSENPTASYPTVYEPIAKAVYAWLYQDAGSAYGHRKFVLAIGLKHNSGKENVEGILSVGVAINQSRSQSPTTYTTEVFTVQNGFDPNENYDMSNVSSVNLVKPDSCLPGYTKTFDDFGPFYCRPILPPLQ